MDVQGKSVSTIAKEQGVSKRSIHNWKLKAECKAGRLLGVIGPNNTYYFSAEDEQLILAERSGVNREAGSEETDQQFMQQQTEQFTVGPSEETLPGAIVSMVGSGIEALAPVAVAAGQRIAREAHAVMIGATADEMYHLANLMKADASMLLATVAAQSNISLPTTTTLVKRGRSALPQQVQPVYPGILGW